MSRKNPRKKRNAKSTKAKATGRRTRRKKRSKLFAAIVIELIATVALFGAYRFAQDVRASQRSDQPEQAQIEQAQPPVPWAQIASAPVSVKPLNQTPVFRVPRRFGFAPEGS